MCDLVKETIGPGQVGGKPRVAMRSGSWGGLRVLRHRQVTVVG